MHCEKTVEDTIDFVKSGEKKYLWAQAKFFCIQSTLVISTSQGDFESVRDNEKLEIAIVNCTFV